MKVKKIISLLLVFSVLSTISITSNFAYYSVHSEVTAPAVHTVTGIVSTEEGGIISEDGYVEKDGSITSTATNSEWKDQTEIDLNKGDDLPGYSNLAELFDKLKVKKTIIFKYNDDDKDHRLQIKRQGTDGGMPRFQLEYLKGGRYCYLTVDIVGNKIDGHLDELENRIEGYKTNIKYYIEGKSQYSNIIYNLLSDYKFKKIYQFRYNVDNYPEKNGELFLVFKSAEYVTSAEAPIILDINVKGLIEAIAGGIAKKAVFIITELIKNIAKNIERKEKAVLEVSYDLRARYTVNNNQITPFIKSYVTQFYVTTPSDLAAEITDEVLKLQYYSGDSDLISADYYDLLELFYDGISNYEKWCPYSAHQTNLDTGICDKCGFQCFYWVTYDANGGSKAPPREKKYYYKPLELNFTDIPVRPGYTFVGWAIDPNKNFPDYYEGEKYEDNINITLYAVWSPIQYKIQYNANGGNGAPQPQSKDHGIILKLSEQKPYREGYTFLGWAFDKNATSATYEPGDNFDGNANFILYAVWKPGTYLISYSANGGSGGPTTQTKTHGIDIYLSSEKPVRTGYTFLGWSSDRNATSPMFQPGEKRTIDAPLDLFAVWKLNEYKISYDANGGSGAPATQTKLHGITLKLSEQKAYREGYTFLGWSIDKYATSPMFEPGDNDEYNESFTLYAVWKPRTYLISYSANGGSGGPTTQTKTHGIDIYLSSEKPTRTGYTFLGWSSDRNATSPMFQPGEKRTNDAPLDLFAVWKLNEYKISYDANGGSGAPATQTKLHGTTLKLSEQKAYREGYTFLGWSTDRNATTAMFQPGDYDEYNESFTLYAVWKPRTYLISYSPNGGSGGPTTQTKTHGIAIYLSTVKPTRSGYTFLGWSSDRNATTAMFQPGEKRTTDAPLDLYAVWKHEHNWSSYWNDIGTSGHVKVCLTTGCTARSSTSNHSLTTIKSSSGHYQKCSAGCGYQTSLQSHSYGSWTSADATKHKRTCTNSSCRYTVSANHGGTWSRYSSTQHRKYCSTCGSYQYESHSWKYNGSQKQCTVCKYE